MTYTGPIWEGVYQSFNEVPVRGPGFDGETWIGNSLKKINILREEAANNTPLPPVSNYRESLLPLLTSLVYSRKQTVRILDFGGGLGFTYFQTIYGLPERAGVEYHIVERESTCQAGREFFGDAESRLFFHAELPISEHSFDIVHCGSVLQYIDDWKWMISRLCSLSRQYLLLVDVLAGNIPTFVSAQNYYESKIPARFLNIEDLFQAVRASGHQLIYSSMFAPVILGVEQNLPMQNFDKKYRLKNTCNLLFAKHHVN